MLTLALTLAGCNLESNGTSTGTELTFPEVPLRAREYSAFSIVDHSPVEGDTHQSLVRDVMVTFDSPLLTESITDANVRLWLGDRKVKAALVYVADTHTIRLLPEKPLQPDQRYRVELTNGLMSSLGLPYGGAEWEFSTAGRIGRTTQDTLDRCVTPDRLAMLGAINKARSQARQCGANLLPAAPELTYQCALTDIAQNHAEELASQSLLSHYSSDGSTLPERADAAGYGWAALGENIARTRSQEAGSLVDGWLGEASPCETLMDPAYTHIGLGRAENREGDFYWVQDLAKPAAGSKAD